MSPSEPPIDLKYVKIGSPEPTPCIECGAVQPQFDMIGSSNGYRCERCEALIDIDRTVVSGKLAGTRPVIIGGLGLGAGSMAPLAAVLPGVPVPFAWTLVLVPMLLTLVVVIDGLFIQRGLAKMKREVHAEALPESVIAQQRIMIALGLIGGLVGSTSATWVAWGLLV